jgi:hypothetical protein
VTFASQLSADFTPIAAVYDTPSVDRALSWAQSLVESYCNRTFDLVTGETVFISPTQYRTAMLPSFPVVNVTAVQALLPPTVGTGGLAWTDLTNYRFVAETGLIYDTTGEPGTTWDLGLSWPWLPESLKVTYDHGYEPVPQALIDVACRFAQQYLENPAQMMQRRTGDQEGRYSGSKGVVFSELDLTILGRYMDAGLS